MRSSLLTLQRCSWLPSQVSKWPLCFHPPCLQEPRAATAHKYSVFADVDEAREAMAPLGLEKRSLIIMPINDNSSIDQAGGTHWC